MTNITITNMHLDGHTIPVPAGLSELIGRAGAWTAEEIPPLIGYHREVKRVDGRLVTELIYIGDAS